MSLMTLRRERIGFTLVELLVSIAVIGILTALTVPALGRAKEKSKRIACLTNLRQLGVASQMYADDDKFQSFSAKVFPEDQDLNWLNRNYLDSPRAFVCPSTKNYVSTNISVSPFNKEGGLKDLIDVAKSRGNVAGKSYQGFGYTGVGVNVFQEIQIPGGFRTINGIRKSLNNVGTYSKHHDAFGLAGTIPGPSRMWLVGDQGLLGVLYYPDEADNHGENGANIVFCDGHVEWVGRSEFILRYELSQDENRTTIALPW